MKFWRGLFAFAAAWNVVTGLGLVAAAPQAAAGMSLARSAGPFAVSLIGRLIASFGVAYAAVAWSPLPNRNLVVIGALSKAGAAVLAAAYAHAGQIAHSTFLFGVADVLFALAFTIFLARTRPARA